MSTLQIKRPKRSRRADLIYTEYQHIFKKLWGLEPDDSELIGMTGSRLFNAEFQEFGIVSYERSVVLPIRNAYYASYNVEPRFENIRAHGKLKEPILDYGCGVGFTLRMLQEHGYDDIYGLDVQGPQYHVLQAMAQMADFTVFNELPINTQYGTIICLNVLEHLPNPGVVLNMLRTRCDKLIANCDESPAAAHIALMEERKRVNDSLREEGEYIVWKECTGAISER